MKKESLKILVLVWFAALSFVASPQTHAQSTNRPRVAETKTVKPAPTPTPIARPVSDPRYPKIASYVQSKVRGILLNPLLRRGRVGLRIDWLDRNAKLLSINSDKYFVPASNMKSYTVAAAIDSLTPNFRFVTSVYASSRPDFKGTLKDNLIVYGRGDPTFSANFYDGNYYRRIDELAEKIVRSGIKEIEGSIIADETYFNAKPIPNGWEWDDLQWYYGAEISSLSINDNSVDLRITPSSDGANCVVSISPFNRLYRVVNKCRTTPTGTQRKMRVWKKLDENLVEVSGTMPENDRGYKGAIAVTRPAGLFAEMLKQRLILKGVKVKGAARAINLEERNGIKLRPSSLIKITDVKSQPLSVIAAKTMKPSQNLYTELILRALGEERGDKTDSEKTSAQKGIEVIKNLLIKAGESPESVIQYDGSGLSRHNLITPDSCVKLYAYMDKSRYAPAWKNSLTVGGVDGTLKRRFKGTSAEANVRGKTGTLDQVSALTGYVTARSGERFVFSILTNNLPNSRLRSQTIDNIVVALADYDSGATAKLPIFFLPELKVN